jgi:hypothetical protein
MYHKSYYVRKNLIQVCICHSTLIVELHNSIINFFFLINSLCIDIINWKSIIKSKYTYFQQNIKNDVDLNLFFIDKQYRQNWSSTFRLKKFRLIFVFTRAKRIENAKQFLKENLIEIIVCVICIHDLIEIILYNSINREKNEKNKVEKAECFHFYEVDDLYC